jgi:hypothetical protein
MTEVDGKLRLQHKLANMRPGETKMIAHSFRVKRDKRFPALFRLKAPNEGWSSMMPIDEIVTFVEKDHFLNLDIMWD